MLSDLNDGSGDNCGAVTFSVDIDTFTAVGVYFVVLTVIDSFGNMHDVTVTVSVIDNTLTVNDIKTEGFKVYPNPTINILHVNFEKQGEYSFLVYDISGKEILR